MIAHDSGARRHATQAHPGGRRRERPEDKTDERLDEALEETFPASDPTAEGGPTRIDPAKPASGHAPRKHETPPASRGRG